MLGGVSVEVDGCEPIAVTAPRQRALLALLILQANRVVTRSTLVESIWGDDTPQNADAALQIVMSRLRRAVGEGADRIVSQGAGYRLDVGPEEVDLTRVEALLRDGRAALALNDATRAADLFDTALALWTGEPLDDLASFPFHQSAARRISDLRLTVYEARNDAYLMGGRHLEVVADIDEWVAAEPLREHLRGQQIAALYRSGRQAEALAACAALRRFLRDALGVDPSPGIQKLERRVLDQDPTLLSTNAGLTGRLPAWTSESLAFVGREEELERVMRALRRACVDGMRFVLVEGRPGKGKSRFLLELARRVGRDAIVLPVDVREFLRPAVVALAHSLATASRRMPPEELRLTLGALPDLESVGSFDSPAEAELLAQAPPWIAALSAKAPVVVLVDDIDRAGPTLLHVIGRLASMKQPRRVLVVASAGTPIETGAPSLHRLVRTLESVDLIDRLTLDPLDVGDIDDLLGRMRIGPHEAIARKLHDLTEGNPFLLAELLSTGRPERVVETWLVPPRVRDVVLARTDELGRAAADTLERAAVFERDFTVGLLSEILDLTESAVTTIVERAVDAHILQPAGARTYRFAHQLARRTLAEELTPAERADAHHRIAVTIERAGEAAAAIAFHWSNAGGPDAAAKTAEYARVAGDDAKRMLEPHIAARWYQLALSHIDADEVRGVLLVDLAEVQQQAGIPEFADTLREAARIAQATDDDGLLVRVVNSASPGWSTLPGFVTSETRQLLSRALEVAPDDATRSRVLARLATELQLHDPDAAEVRAREAIVLARASGDDIALLESLFRHASMLQAPGSLARRRAEIDEASALAARTHDEIAAYFLLSLGAVTAIQAADVPAAEAAVAGADAIAGQHDLAPLRWSAMTRRAWRAGLAGRLADAERFLFAARDFGRATGLPHAEHTALLQLAILRWQQGRAGSVVAAAQDAVGELASFPGLRYVLVRALAAEKENRPVVRRLMLELAERDFEELPVGSFWASVLVVSAETAFLLDLPDVARVIRELLDPYVDQIAFAGSWVAAPVAYGSAVAAAASGDPSAGDLFELAIAMAERLDAPLLRARTQLAWVHTGNARSGSLSAPDAISLCEDAGTTAKVLGLDDLASSAVRLQVAASR